MKDVTDSDYMHAERVCKDFKIKKLRSISRFYPKADIY